MVVVGRLQRRVMIVAHLRHGRVVMVRQLLNPMLLRQAGPLRKQEVHVIQAQEDTGEVLLSVLRSSYVKIQRLDQLELYRSPADYPRFLVRTTSIFPRNTHVLPLPVRALRVEQFGAQIHVLVHQLCDGAGDVVHLFDNRPGCVSPPLSRGIGRAGPGSIPHRAIHRVGHCGTSLRDGCGTRPRT